ncbi:MAG: heme-copper oxidase subunit III [Alphaproteobacteria bacterium]|nr:heme-copper oxidase subunit III [Alphaproteobacteria bacterium]
MVDTASAHGRALTVGAIARRGTGWWGLLTVIATEAALFVYLLFSYFYYDVQFGRGWLPDPPSFRYSLPNTIILVASNIAAWVAARGIQRGGRGRLVVGILVALLLGVAFCVLQVLEWRSLTYTLNANTYSSVYFTTGGFHLAHVVVGVLILLLLLLWSVLGYFDRLRHTPVLIGTAYWHFVLAVWLAVFFSFYVTPYLW